MTVGVQHDLLDLREEALADEIGEVPTGHPVEQALEACAWVRELGL
jgi:hypothetical protein